MEQVINVLPSKVMVTLLIDPALMHMVERCLDEKELVEQFARLYGIGLPQIAKSPIEYMVDEATGWRSDQYREFFNAFIPFVHRAVYLPLKAEFELASRYGKGGKNKKGDF